MRHLTARAVEWLRGGGPGTKFKRTPYQMPTALPACRVKEFEPLIAVLGRDSPAINYEEAVALDIQWTGVEEVRAMVKKWKYAYRIRHDRNGYGEVTDERIEKCPIEPPNCPLCQVILDTELTTTKRGPSREGQTFKLAYAD